MTKEDLVLALLNEGVEGWMEVEVPEFPDLPTPSETDQAVNSYVLACYAANCNAFMQCFSGLHLFDYLLRGLQRSNPMIALAMASLEGNLQGEGRLIFLFPDTNAVCQGFVRVVVSASEDISEVACTIGGITRMMVPIVPGTFEVRYLLPVGPYTITVEGFKEVGSSLIETRDFSIAGFEHDPGDAYIPAGNYEVAIFCTGSVDLITSISAKISDEIVLDREGNDFNGIIEFTVGESNLDFHIFPANFPDYHQYQIVVAE